MLGRSWIAAIAAAVLAIGGAPPSVRAQAALRVELVDARGVSMAAAGDERAIAIAGAEVAIAGGRVRGERDLPARLAAAYDAMAREVGAVPSPRFAREDALLVMAPAGAATDRAIVFLHGLGGSFALPCWAIARAAAREGWATICPSIGEEGAWWTDAGEARVRSAIDLARARGARTIALAGLSNGARGAAELASRIEGIERVVLISGASRSARPVVPTLVVQGDRDRMSGLAHARRYVARAPRRCTLAIVSGGHFVLLDRLDPIGGIVQSFLRQRGRL